MSNWFTELKIGAGAVSRFGEWLGIHPSLQDIAKALILIAFVLAILMVVGDVYRGEIQNRMHRIRLVATPKSGPPLRAEATLADIRRRVRRERDIFCHVPSTLVPVTLDQVYSDVVLYLRYRDMHGRIRSKQLISYRARFRTRLRALASSLYANLMSDHVYTEAEQDRFVNEEETPVAISMAGSRVDYIEIGLVQAFMERLSSRYERARKNALRKVIQGAEAGLRPPQRVGLVAQFRFPISPYFLLYKHPDTNVRTTAWLTVLTSVFALFMQLIYAGNGPDRDVLPRFNKPETHVALSTSTNIAAAANHAAPNEP